MKRCELSQVTDSDAWAKEFMKTFKDQDFPLEWIDQDVMRAWFSGAMMAMHDHVERKYEKEKLPDRLG